jgi:hypothetical protein
VFSFKEPSQPPFLLLQRYNILTMNSISDGTQLVRFGGLNGTWSVNTLRGLLAIVGWAACGIVGFGLRDLDRTNVFCGMTCIFLWHGLSV